MRLAESSRTLVETLWLLLRRRELEATGRWKGDQGVTQVSLLRSRGISTDLSEEARTPSSCSNTAARPLSSSF